MGSQRTSDVAVSRLSVPLACAHRVQSRDDGLGERCAVNQGFPGALLSMPPVVVRVLNALRQPSPRGHSDVEDGGRGADLWANAGARGVLFFWHQASKACARQLCDAEDIHIPESGVLFVSSRPPFSGGKGPPLV